MPQQPCQKLSSFSPRSYQHDPEPLRATRAQELPHAPLPDPLGQPRGRCSPPPALPAALGARPAARGRCGLGVRRALRGGGSAAAEGAPPSRPAPARPLSARCPRRLPALPAAASAPQAPRGHGRRSAHLPRGRSPPRARPAGTPPRHAHWPRRRPRGGLRGAEWPGAPSVIAACHNTPGLLSERRGAAAAAALPAAPLPPPAPGPPSGMAPQRAGAAR